MGGFWGRLWAGDGAGDGVGWLLGDGVDGVVGGVVSRVVDGWRGGCAVPVPAAPGEADDAPSAGLAVLGLGQP